MKLRFLRFLGVGILFLTLLLGCRLEDNTSQIYKVDLATQAKEAYEKENPTLPILNYTKSIEWNNPIVNVGNLYDVVEIPLVLNTVIGVQIGEEVSKPNARLLLRKNKNSETWNFYYLIISNGNNRQNYNISYNDIEENFPNKIIVFDKNNNRTSTYDPKTTKTNYKSIVKMHLLNVHI